MTITVTLDPSGPPKRRIVELAFGDLGMAGYEFGRTPEEIGSALVRLNALMREWPFSGLGYVQPTYGNGSADEASGIADQYENAIAAALALRLAPEFGVTFSPEAAANLSKSRTLLASEVATVPTMPYGRHTPRGTGVRTTFGPFIEESAPVSTDYDPGDIAGLVE